MKNETCNDCVVVEGENPSVMEIQLCPLHAAAQELLKAAKVGLSLAEEINAYTTASIIKAAIFKAEGH